MRIYRHSQLGYSSLGPFTRLLIFVTRESNFDIGTKRWICKLKQLTHLEFPGENLSSGV